MEAARLKIRVLPRASRNQICGWQGPQLKVRLAAPPVDGRANEALLDFLKEALELKGGQAALVSGAQSRSKTVEFKLAPADLRGRLEKYLREVE